MDIRLDNQHTAGHLLLTSPRTEFVKILFTSALKKHNKYPRHHTAT